MQYYWNVILEFVRGCIKLLDDKLVPISSDASAIILFVVAVGLIVLLIVIVTTKRGLDKSTPLPRTTVVPLNGTEPSAQMAAR